MPNCYLNTYHFYGFYVWNEILYSCRFLASSMHPFFLHRRDSAAAYAVYSRSMEIAAHSIEFRTAFITFIIRFDGTFLGKCAWQWNIMEPILGKLLAILLTSRVFVFETQLAILCKYSTSWISQTASSIITPNTNWNYRTWFLVSKFCFISFTKNPRACIVHPEAQVDTLNGLQTAQNLTRSQSSYHVRVLKQRNTVTRIAGQDASLGSMKGMEAPPSNAGQCGLGIKTHLNQFQNF